MEKRNKNHSSIWGPPDPQGEPEKPKVVYVINTVFTLCWKFLHNHTLL